MSDDAIVQGLGELPTATISDALDRLGIVGQCLGIAPLDPKLRLAGRAFTLRYRPTGLVERGNQRFRVAAGSAGRSSTAYAATSSARST